MAIVRGITETKTEQGNQAGAGGGWRTLLDLALCLEAQGRAVEALPLAIRAAVRFQKLHGMDDPGTRRARKTVERLRPG